MENADDSSDPLAELDAAWEKEKRPLQTPSRWGASTDPTLRDVVFLMLGGFLFIFVGSGYLALCLLTEDKESKLNPLYTPLFFLVAVVYFCLSAGVKRRLKRFRIAKAEYEEKRSAIERKLA